MTLTYVLVSASLVVGLLNLTALLFLSNALFRILLTDRPTGKSQRAVPQPEKGLVEPKQSMTYDPRFVPKNNP